MCQIRHLLLRSTQEASRSTWVPKLYIYIYKKNKVPRVRTRERGSREILRLVRREIIPRTCTIVHGQDMSKSRPSKSWQQQAFLTHRQVNQGRLGRFLISTFRKDQSSQDGITTKKVRALGNSRSAQLCFFFFFPLMTMTIFTYRSVAFDSEGFNRTSCLNLTGRGAV